MTARLRYCFKHQPVERFAPSVGRVFGPAYRRHFEADGFSWDSQAPDVLFTLLPDRETRSGSVPFVVCSRDPSCDFTNSLLTGGSFWSDDPETLLSNPSFLGILKDRHFTDPSYLEGPRLDGRWLNGRLASDYRQIGESDRDTDRYLEVATVRTYDAPRRALYDRSHNTLWDFHFSPLQAGFDRLCAPPASWLATQRWTRSIDVFCSLSVYPKRPDLQLVRWHRQRCLRQIATRRDLTCRTGIRISRGRRYQLELLRSRIAVSPWGGGAWCLRDIESLLAGVVTIKPPCPWVRMAGFEDLYRPDNPYFVECRSDFADLPEVIDEVLRAYRSHFERTQEARRALMARRAPGAFIRAITGTARALLSS